MIVTNYNIYFIAIIVSHCTQLVLGRTCCQPNRFGRRFFILHRRPMLRPMPMPTAILQLVKIEEKPFPTQASFDIPVPKSRPVVPSPVINEEPAVNAAEKAIICAQLTCSPDELETPVCACNFVTGNVVSFNNKCDMKKHNCRFDTGFKPILYKICPWEFESRRAEIPTEAEAITD